MARRVKVRGGKRMKERGRTRVELWLDPNELSLIDAAATAAGQKRATWIREKAYHAAEAVALERVREERRDAPGR